MGIEGAVGLCMVKVKNHSKRNIHRGGRYEIRVVGTEFTYCLATAVIPRDMFQSHHDGTQWHAWMADGCSQGRAESLFIRISRHLVRTTSSKIGRPGNMEYRCRGFEGTRPISSCMRAHYPRWGLCRSFQRLSTVWKTAVTDSMTVESIWFPKRCCILSGCHLTRSVFSKAAGSRW